jgi:predicted nuclease of predicted toxin-antitoxin system
VKFLVDMPLAPALALWLQNEGHDAIHVMGLGLHRAPDSEILMRAAQEARTVITADLDYPRLIALAAASGPSLILFRGGDWSDADAIARMREILRSLDERDVAQSILVVERGRVRRRRLPIT